MSVEEMIPVNIDEILSETGLSPRALAKVTGLNWSHLRKVRSRGKMRPRDVERLVIRLDEHAKYGRVNPEIRHRGDGLESTFPRVKFVFPGAKRSTKSMEVERLKDRLHERQVRMYVR